MYPCHWWGGCYIARLQDMVCGEVLKDLSLVKTLHLLKSESRPLLSTSVTVVAEGTSLDGVSDRWTAARFDNTAVFPKQLCTEFFTRSDAS
jgi:hypothetical protein